MSGFFIRGNSSRKNKKVSKSTANGQATQAKRKRKDDKEIASDSDLESDDGEESVLEPEDTETAQEKRFRLAKDYISQLKAREKELHDDDDGVDDGITKRLQEEVLEHAGRLQRTIADNYEQPLENDIKIFRGHKTSVTCVCVSSDDRHIYSAAKDGEIIKWNLDTGSKECRLGSKRKPSSNERCENLDHNVGSVLCMALSGDGKYLVCGGDAKLVLVWNSSSLTWRHTFYGHRGHITALAFRRGSNQLFSGSQDKCVKVWSVDQMAYMETLFGHEDVVIGIDSFHRDRALTCGARDRSVRLWKIPEESQLVFHGKDASIDCVSYINEDTFVSGDDNGNISLWNAQKKKPLYTRRNAHRNSTDNGECWVSSVVAMPNSDFVASGSSDGNIRYWKCDKGCRVLNPLFNIEISGFINDLKFTSSGNFLIAAVGKEHRMGRWWSNKDAKNSVVLIKLNKKLTDENSNPSDKRGLNDGID